ncbi:hypothetical protein GGR20_000320 [Devosia subaequoris]|uniref:Uncharacterized protein n=1 Tax=Devosia subaequoris TaxID=395930 RepID=A0A7W6IJD0_9HYPH|nr:hypothetical protein [Devosia subaequoris]MBB4050702.1 hypothetical protein [Devosia subaequoris]MCP1208617.1 hypothetical protein [Devosia subaequoris]
MNWSCFRQLGFWLNRIVFIFISHAWRCSQTMATSGGTRNAATQTHSICDDFATMMLIQNTEISHQRFGDVSRHNLTLKQGAWHSGGCDHSSKGSENAPWVVSTFPMNAGLIERRKAPETVAMDTHLRTRMVPQASARQAGVCRVEHRCDGTG